MKRDGCLQTVKRKPPWLKSEMQILKANLDRPITEMLRLNILPGRTYWEIYNTLACEGYVYDFKKKKYKKDRGY